MIRVDEISREFDGLKALDRVSFTINDGGALAVLGPSGCGKTTLLRLIAGLEVPGSGNIWFDDREVSGPGWADPPYSRSVGFVFQSPALWPHMTLEQNVLFGMEKIPGPERDALLSELFSRAGIAHLRDRYPDEVSGGEARRVSIIRAIGPRPDIILMDEPLTHLDQELKENFLEVIREIADDPGVILVYVTHDTEEVDRIGIPKIHLLKGKVETKLPGTIEDDR